MSLKDWFSVARGQVALIQEIRGLRLEVKRVADHLQGVPPEGEEPSIELYHHDDADIRRRVAAERSFAGEPAAESDGYDPEFPEDRP